MVTAFPHSQPTGSKNQVTNVAIVGIGGHVGRFIAESLIERNKHRVTAITRTGSTNKVLSGVYYVKKVDYDDHGSLVQALEGQDVLIITMAVTAPPDSQKKLIDAAIEAGVSYVMPNEWGIDLSKIEAAKDTNLYDSLTSIRQYIEKAGAGKTKWIVLSCGFWYEHSLAGTEARYGFDFDEKTVTFYDEGRTKINTTTWPQVGRAVASLLSLTILPADENDQSLSLSHYHNKPVHVSSFFISQRDMFDSVLRVTRDDEKDWKVTHEDVVGRFRRGQQLLKGGSLLGYGILLYARIFYDDGSGEFNDKLDNDLLGLPKENLDHATKEAVRMALAGETSALH